MLDDLWHFNITVAICVSTSALIFLINLFAVVTWTDIVVTLLLELPTVFYFFLIASVITIMLRELLFLHFLLLFLVNKLLKLYTRHSITWWSLSLFLLLARRILFFIYFKFDVIRMQFKFLFILIVTYFILGFFFIFIDLSRSSPPRSLILCISSLSIFNTLSLPFLLFCFDVHCLFTLHIYPVT
jgi:hypothetical protein